MANDQPGELRRVLVVSPHYDDAVLSCGQLLATYRPVHVVTVFGGNPGQYSELTDWDRRSGFAVGDDVVAARQAEERAALRSLDAQTTWLEFLDGQYGCTPSAEEVAEALESAIGRIEPTAVFFPLGIFHSDHLLASEACLQLADRAPDRGWYLYEDVLYRCKPGLQEARQADLVHGGHELELVAPAPDGIEAKWAAVERYPSQLRGLAAAGWPVEDIFAPERYWRLR
jgi:LmbE family N-acetylglucosaminyl deacetylase